MCILEKLIWLLSGELIREEMESYSVQSKSISLKWLQFNKQKPQKITCDDNDTEKLEPLYIAD